MVDAQLRVVTMTMLANAMLIRRFARFDRRLGFIDMRRGGGMRARFRGQLRAACDRVHRRRGDEE